VCRSSVTIPPNATYWVRQGLLGLLGDAAQGVHQTLPDVFPDISKLKEYRALFERSATVLDIAGWDIQAEPVTTPIDLDAHGDTLSDAINDSARCLESLLSEGEDDDAGTRAKEYETLIEFAVALSIAMEEPTQAV
jgi:hypothetical protein